MKVENATIGTRVIAKDLSNCKLGSLTAAKGQTGTIVAFEGTDPVVRFDNKFVDGLWSDRYRDLKGKRHWAIPASDLKLDSKELE